MRSSPIRNGSLGMWCCRRPDKHHRTSFHLRCVQLKSAAPHPRRNFIDVRIQMVAGHGDSSEDRNHKSVCHLRNHDDAAQRCWIKCDRFAVAQTRKKIGPRTDPILVGLHRTLEQLKSWNQNGKQTEPDRRDMKQTTVESVQISPMIAGRPAEICSNGHQTITIQRLSCNVHVEQRIVSHFRRKTGAKCDQPNTR